MVDLSMRMQGIHVTPTYDERNNRSTKRLQTPSSDTTEYYTYNEGDQLLSMTRKDTVTQTILVSYTYAYDTQGRRTSQTKTSVTPPEVTSYSYQVGGNLKQITLPDSSTIQYQYDAYGNRIQKETSTELIAYHYSGASLQKEVHKDPSTLTILYTLTYVPWGFVKTVGQTSTSYYYLYDQRGNTRGITDAQGTILETYHYSPYGILLSTPSISQPHFLSGNAQCQYEAESSLYYMHARYYDAHTGRFLTKDALPGSMSSPLSQNRYTYCQNDPITLIDPTGNSPQNTGNPPRMSGPNANTSSDPCVLPDVAGDSGAVHFSGMGIPGKMELPKNPNPAMVIGGTSPGVLTAGYDACGEYRWDDVSSQLTEDEKDAGFVHKYQLIINGIAVTVYETKNGTLHAFPKTGSFFDHQGRTSSKSLALAIGLNIAFGKLSDEGLSVGNVGAFLSGLVSFARENLGTFMNIVGGGLNGLTQFMKHATIGYVIKEYIANDPYTGDHDDRSNDYGIAFWTSYYNEKMGYNSTFYTNRDKNGLDENGQYTDETVLGLFDQTRIMKAVQYKENAKQLTGIVCDNGDTKDWGLFSVNDYYFPKAYKDSKYKNIHDMHFGDIWKTNTFANIGAGVGMFFSYQYDGGNTGNGNPFTLKDAKHSIVSYNPGNPLLYKVMEYMNNQNHRFPGVRLPEEL